MGKGTLKEKKSEGRVAEKGMLEEKRASKLVEKGKLKKKAALEKRGTFTEAKTGRLV